MKAPISDTLHKPPETDAPQSARPCYLCRSQALETIARHVDFGLPIRACRVCGLAQTDPVPSAFLDTYYQYAYGEDHGRAESESYIGYCERRGHAQAAFIAEASGGRRFTSVLDFGAGPGGALAAFAGAGVRTVGCEPDPQMRAIMAARPGVEDVGQQALFSGAYDGQFDLVILSHVLEHLSDPTFELAKLRRLMRGDGMLFVETPAETTDLLPEITERLRLGAGHIFHFSPDTLPRVIAADELFEVVELRRCGVSFPDLLTGAASLDADASTPTPDGVWLRALARATARDPALAAPRAPTAHADENELEALHAVSRARNALLRVSRKAYASLLRATPAGAHRSTGLEALPFNTPPTNDLAELADVAHRTLQRRREMLRDLRLRLNEHRARLRRTNERIAELKEQNETLRGRVGFQQEKAKLLQDDADELRGKIAGFELAKEELTAQLAQNAERLAKTERKRIDLNGRLAQSTRRRQELNTQVRELSEHVEAARARTRDKEQQLVRQGEVLAEIQGSRAYRLGQFLLRPFAAARNALQALRKRLGRS